MNYTIEQIYKGIEYYNSLIDYNRVWSYIKSDLESNMILNTGDKIKFSKLVRANTREDGLEVILFFKRDIGDPIRIRQTIPFIGKGSIEEFYGKIKSETYNAPINLGYRMIQELLKSIMK
jgi:hypothetical protein